MREYFDHNQERFYAEFRKDETKWTLERQRSRAVEGFRMKYVQEGAMAKDYEAMINAIWEDDYESHVLMFLYGARERELMLK